MGLWRKASCRAVSRGVQRDRAEMEEGNEVTSDAANPMLVEVTRGDMVESRHRASYAVVDPDGRVVLQAGLVEQPVYPRSAIKPIQALALVESGAAEAFGLGDAEIALACASHNGEARHSETVTGLARANRLLGRRP